MGFEQETYYIIKILTIFQTILIHLTWYKNKVNISAYFQTVSGVLKLKLYKLVWKCLTRSRC